MASIIRNAAAKKRNRRTAGGDNPNRPRPATPIFVVVATIAGSVLTLTFDQPVMLDGVPAYKTDLVGPVAVSAVKTANNTVAVTFSAPITEAVNLNVGFRDPAIRNASGGYVTSNFVLL